MNASEVMEKAKRLAVKFEPVGSRRSVNPPPLDTDDDWLFLTDKENLNKICFMVDNDYEPPDETDQKCPKSKIGSEFISLRVEEFNLIVTTSEPFFDKFMLAQRVCEQLNLMEKRQRVIVFRAILYSEAPYISMTTEQLMEMF